MKALQVYWQAAAKRFNALSLRERLLVFGVAAGVLFVTVDALSLSGVRQEQRMFSRQVLESKSRVRAVDAQIETIEAGQRTDPDAENRRRLELLKQKLASMDASLQGTQHNLVTPEKMGKLLEDLLSRNRNLQLVSLKTLPVTGFADGKDAKDALLYKHGVQITVVGTYGDLTRYLTEVEGLPWRVLWGGIEMHTGAYPETTLTLTLYTLSLNKTWLSV